MPRFYTFTFYKMLINRKHFVMHHNKHMVWWYAPAILLTEMEIGDLFV